MIYFSKYQKINVMTNMVKFVILYSYVSNKRRNEGRGGGGRMLKINGVAGDNIGSE